MTEIHEPTSPPQEAIRLAQEALQRGVRGRAELIEEVSAALPGPTTFDALFALGALSERLLDDSLLSRSAAGPASRSRRETGVYYTPADLVRRTLREAIPTAPRGKNLCICDPSCGGGAFLIGAVEQLVELGVPAERAVAMMRGIEVDETSAVIALALLGRCGPVEPSAVVVADALMEAGDAWTESCDVVVGNPPFVDSEALCRLQPGWREAVAARYCCARGNWDLACIFIERALQMLRPWGRLAMIVPARILAADYAASLHSLLLREARLEAILDGGGACFAGATMPVAILVASRSPSPAAVRVEWEGVRRAVEPSQLEVLPAGHWSAIAAPARHEPWVQALTRQPERFVPLGDVCGHIGDGLTTAEAYAIAPLIREYREGDSDDAIFRVANTGTIDPWRFLWGERPMRWLGREYLRPVVEREALRRLLPRRAAQAERPKVLLAGLSRRIEAVVDAEGGWMCGKSAFQALPRPGVNLWALAGMLNSEAATEIATVLFGLRGLGRAGTSLCLGARQWRNLALPATLIEGPEVGELGRRWAAAVAEGGEQGQWKGRLEDMMTEAAGTSKRAE